MERHYEDVLISYTTFFVLLEGFSGALYFDNDTRSEVGRESSGFIYTLLQGGAYSAI